MKLGFSSQIDEIADTSPRFSNGQITEIFDFHGFADNDKIRRELLRLLELQRPIYERQLRDKAAREQSE